VFIVMGADGPTLYDNTTFAGPVPVEVPEENWPSAWRPREQYMHTAAQPGQRPTGGFSGPAELPEGIPVISQAQLQQVQQYYTRYTSSGGGGRTSPTFDRRLLRENFTEEWRSKLLVAPPELDRLVDAYIQEATSFYLTTGTQTNWQAWLLEQIRQNPRYRTMYAQKPEGMSEDEYLGRYQNVAQQFGLRPWSETAATERGMTSGSNVGAFAEGLGQSREYQAGHIGDLSRAFQNTFSQLGVLRGS
jgi:hypothetical protein